MLYHSWKYLSLIQDVFGIKNNQFTYTEKGKQEIFELDFGNNQDEILSANAFIGFHEAGPNVDKELNIWTKEKEEISGVGMANGGDLSSNLTAAMDKLPQMTEKKKKIDMHVKIAS
jgi:esterase/lipase